METILQILQWAVPGGIGGAVMWLLSREVRSAHTAKEVHDTYKDMYSDVSQSLTSMREENEKLYNAILRLENAVRRANTCRYWDTCPIRSELPQSAKRRGADDIQRRQPQAGQHRIRDSGDRGSGCTGRLSESDSTDDSDTEPSRGCDVQSEEGTDTYLVEA